jgi:hypothetical protein
MLKTCTIVTCRLILLAMAIEHYFRQGHFAGYWTSGLLRATVLQGSDGSMKRAACTSLDGFLLGCKRLLCPLALHIADFSLVIVACCRITDTAERLTATCTHDHDSTPCSSLS